MEKQRDSDEDTQNRLFKSMVTIVCVNIGGYLLNTVLINIYTATLSQRKEFWRNKII
jgi:hypothetical protein